MNIPPNYLYASSVNSKYVIASQNKGFNKSHITSTFQTQVITGKSVRDAMNDVTEEHVSSHDELIRKLKYWLSVNSRTVVADATEIGVGELISIKQDSALSNCINAGRFYLQVPIVLFTSTDLELTNDVDMVIRILQAKAKNSR